jgi:hypothetical protein
MKKVCVFLDKRKKAKMQWEQDPNQSNVDNLNNVIFYENHPVVLYQFYYNNQS